MSSIIKRTFLLMVFFFKGPLSGVSIVVLNDAADIASSQKVWLQFNLEPGQQGIFKNTLQFSVDHPDVSLVAWNTSTMPTDLFSSSLKKTQRIFSESFTGCLSLHSKHHDMQQRQNLLADTKLYVSCFVMRKNGKTKPFSTKLALSTPQAVDDRDLSCARSEASTLLGPKGPSSSSVEEFTPEPCRRVEGYVRSNGSTGSPRAQESDNQPYQLPAFLPVPDLAKDFEPIENLGRLWITLCSSVTSAVFGKAFFWWYGLVLLLLGATFLKRRFLWLRFIAPLNGAAEREFIVLLGFLLATGLLFSVHFFMVGVYKSPTALARAYALYSFAGLCCLGMLYVLVTTTQESSFLGKVKSLIGFVLGTMILPIMLKAYLMQQGL